MTTAREEILCPCPDCNHSYTRRRKLPTIEDCPHLVAHPDDNPKWGEDLLAAFLEDYSWRFRQMGINVETDIEKYDRRELKRQRDCLERIIRKHIKEVDGFFFRCNIAHIDDAIFELRPILMGLQRAGS